MTAEELTRRGESALVISASQLLAPGVSMADLLPSEPDADVKIGEEIVFRDGRVFERHVQPHRVRDEVTGWVWCLREVTERRRAEREHARLATQLLNAHQLESLGLLAAEIAHDLNNLLTPILCLTELGRDSLPPNHAVQSSLAGLKGAADRARDLVAQILTCSRHGEQRQEPVRLSPLIEEALMLLRVAAPRNVEFAFADEAPNRKVLGVPTQLHQIVMNLGTNAWQAYDGKPGRVQLGVSERTLTNAEVQQFGDVTPGDYVLLTVQDQGPGMDAQTRAKVFQRFFTTKPAGRGTGLGLSLVQGIVKSAGGAIRISSAPGEGCRVEVLLPAAAESCTAPPAPSERSGKNCLK